jgi:DNA-binding transcriptional regulator GbsR (MarR family)
LITKVTDVRSHARAQIEHAVRAIGRSKYKKGVFEAVCYHKKKIKTVTEISEMTGFDRINVLQAAGELGAEGIIHKTKKDGEIAYEKDDFFSNAKNKAKILRRVEKRGELEKTPVAITLEHGIKDIKIFKPSSKDNVRSRIALITRVKCRFTHRN